MDTRLDHEVEAATEESIVPQPPLWLLKLVAFLSPPPGEHTEPGLIVKSLWWAYRSLGKVLIRLPLAIAQDIYAKAVEAFYWKTTLLQACILLCFFSDVLTRGMIVVMALTMTMLMVRDAYCPPEDIFEWRIYLIFLAPELLLSFGILVAWLRPTWDVPLLVIWQRCLLIGALIYLCVRLYSRVPRSKLGDVYQAVLDAHKATWIFTCAWFAGWFAYLVTGDQLVTPGSSIQAWLTIPPSMMLFTTSLRLQLNPIGGVHRKRAVENTLTGDRILEQLTIMRDYLLVGSNWFARPTLKSTLEMGSFLWAISIVGVPLVRWYIGSRIGVDWLQLVTHAFAYIGLTAMWFHVRELHRRTQKLFDEAIARHKARKAMGLAV